MDLLLKILGGLFLLLLIGLVVVFFLIRYFWRLVKAARMEIELEEDPDPKWLDRSEVHEALEAYRKLGFEVFKVYKEISTQVKPCILANTKHDQFGELYLTANELVCGFSADSIDGISLNVTNTEMAECYAIKPDKVFEYYPKASPAELYEHFKVMIEGVEIVVEEEDGFTERLQAKINKELLGAYDTHERPLWEDGKPIFFERWRKHAKKAKDLDETYAFMVSENLESLEETVTEQMEASETLSAKDHNHYQYQFFVYNPRFEKQGFRMYLESTFACHKRVKPKQLQELEAQAADTESFFNAVKQTYPELKLKAFFELSEPVAAEVIGYEDSDSGVDEDADVVADDSSIELVETKD